MQVSIPSLLQSKKFGAAALASILSFVGVREGLSIEQIALITAPLYAYIAGQGLADLGKSKAQIDAVFAKPKASSVNVTNMAAAAASDLDTKAADKVVLEALKRNRRAVRAITNSET